MNLMEQYTFSITSNKIESHMKSTFQEHLILAHFLK